MSPSPVSFSGRVAAIDQLRAIAIICMLSVIIGPGVLLRLPGTDALLQSVYIWSKFATPSFIFVFGVTVGFIHYHRFHSTDQSLVVRRLSHRMRLVFICAIIICLPSYITLWSQSNFSFTAWLSVTFSVLNFYVLAFLSAAFWLKILGDHPLRNALLLSIAYWVIAIILYELWPSDPSRGIIEYLRINLVSGPYAYFRASAVAILALPLGIYMRRAMLANKHDKFILTMIPVGIGLILGGWLIAEMIGEFHLEMFASGDFKKPPRLWYWMFFSGLSLLALMGLVALEIHVSKSATVLYPLSLFGQGALPIYTSAGLVLAVMRGLDSIVLVEGVYRIILSLALFGGICIAVMWYQHQKHRRKDRVFVSA